MADSEHFCRRVIELEVELRLVKEQLAQARQGTQYLVNCFGAQQAPTRAPTTNADARLREIEDENTKLRRRLASIGGRGDKWLLEGRPCHSCFPLGLPEVSRSCSFESLVDGEIRPGGRSDDLLSFDEAGPTSFTTTNGSLLDADSALDGQDSSFLGDSDDSPLSRLTPAAVYEKERDAFASSSGAGTETSEGEPEQPLSSGSFSTDDGEWQAMRPAPAQGPDLVFSKPFAHWEHSHLVGMATFIEDMSNGEQESYWKGREIKEPKHSAEEWKKYYEAVVRPRYLAIRGHNPEIDQETSSLSKQDKDEYKEEESRCMEDVTGGVDGGSKIAIHNLLRASAEPFKTMQDYSQDLVGGEEKQLPENATHVETPTTVQQEEQIEQVAYVEPFEADSISLQKDIKSSSSASTASFKSYTSAVEQIVSIPPPGVVPEDTLPSPQLAKTAWLATSMTVSTTPLTSTSLPNHLRWDSRSSSGRSTPRGSRGNGCQRFPMGVDQLFFCYDAHNISLCRTVLLSNIPSSLSLAEVLDVVRGGKIVTATYLQTAGFKTTPPIASNSVIVVFLHSGSAMGFVDYCNKQGITLGHEDGKEASSMAAKIVRTPSRLLSPRTMQEVRRGLTRVLFVIDEQSQWTPDQVNQEFMNQETVLKRPVVCGRDESGILFFQFADIKDSAEAWKIVDQDFLFFRGASKGFWPDPCERSWTIEMEQGPADPDKSTSISEVEDYSGKA